MSVFLDSCVIIARYHDKEQYHSKCIELVNKYRESKIHITSATAIEVLRIFREKLNNLIVRVIAMTRNIDFTDNMDENKEIVEGIFNELKKEYSRQEGFLETVKKKSIYFLERGQRNLNILAEWSNDLIKSIEKDLKEITGYKVPLKCPKIQFDIHEDELKRIKELIAGVNFKDSTDEIIFYELILNRQKYHPINFYTIDPKFVKKADKAKAILMKEGMINNCTIHFIDFTKE